MRMSTAILVAVCCAPSALAQKPVGVSGTIEKLSVPQACAPTATHRLRDTDVLLTSTAVDLDGVPGIPMKFIGTDVPGACPLVSVSAVQSAPFSLSVCNQPALGCLVSLDMCPHPTNGSYLIWASLAPGYAPISVATGTFLLDPLLFVPIAIGVNTAVCQSSPLPLSGGAGLVGLSILFQGVATPITGPAVLSTVTRITILPPTVPCTNFECY